MPTTMGRMRFMGWFCLLCEVMSVLTWITLHTFSPNVKRESWISSWGGSGVGWADATYCANGEWCVSTINGSARPGVWVMNARRFEGDTMIVHPLHGVEFPSHEAARQAQYEADLIVEFIPRDQREVVSA